MDDPSLLEVLHAAADAVAIALRPLDDWRPATERAGQYHIDVVADRVAVEVLLNAGLGVVSEETGVHAPDREVVVVVDPVDGSTNASRGVRWYATSLCAVDEGGARAALVVDQASGERFEATRGGGARLDGRPIAPSGCAELGEALVALNGVPDQPWPWGQVRVFGAAALDLCAVACGRVDAYADATVDTLGPWDYLGGLLVCREAGATVSDAGGRELVVIDPSARRTPLAASTSALHRRLVEVRGGAHERP